MNTAGRHQSGEEKMGHLMNVLDITSIDTNVSDALRAQMRSELPEVEETTGPCITGPLRILRV